MSEFIQIYKFILVEAKKLGTQSVEMFIEGLRKTYIGFRNKGVRLETMLRDNLNGTLELHFSPDLTKCETKFYPLVPLEEATPLTYSNLVYKFNQILEYMMENQEEIEDCIFRIF